MSHFKDQEYEPLVGSTEDEVTIVATLTPKYEDKVSASDYFTMLYPTVQYSFLMSLSYNYFSWILLFVSLKVMPKFSFKLRINSFLILGAAILFAIPFVHMVMPTNSSSMIMSLVLTFFSGCLSSLLFGSLLGLVALFPSEYTGAVMAGNGVAGVIASLLRIITKVSVPDTNQGLKKSGFLYFFLGGTLLLFCFASFLLLLSLPITKQILQNYEDSKKSNSGSVNDTNEVSTQRQVSIISLFKRVWKEAFVVFTIFFTTLSLFPGITSLVVNIHTNLSQDWFQIIFVLFFMVGDLIGRTIPKWIILFNANNLWIPTVLRLAFFPLFCLCVNPVVFKSDAWYFIFMFVFAVSNGYCGTLAMMFGPSKAEEHEKEVAGIIMSFCLNFGIWISTHFAFLVLYLLTGSTGIKF
eukprot:gene9726-11356_t